jgi:hypothetical protein
MNGSTPAQVPVVDASGAALLHHVTGCATANDDDGVIYLVNLWTPDGFPAPNTGSVVRYNVQRGTASTVADKLNFPNMVAVSQGRTLYVSANSVCPANGGPPADCQFMGQTSGVLLKITQPERN